MMRPDIETHPPRFAGERFAMTPDEARALHRIERAADWLDARFRLPGTRLRFGLDGLLGLVPGVGDAAGLAASAWIVATAREAGAPWGLVARMALNIAVDAVVGAVPLVGDLFDFGFKANRRNAALLRRHFTGGAG